MSSEKPTEDEPATPVSVLAHVVVASRGTMTGGGGGGDGGCGGGSTGPTRGAWSGSARTTGNAQLKQVFATRIIRCKRRSRTDSGALRNCRTASTVHSIIIHTASDALV